MMNFELTLYKRDPKKTEALEQEFLAVKEKRKEKIATLAKSYDKPMCNDFKDYPYELVLTSINEPDNSELSQEIHDKFTKIVFGPTDQRDKETEEFFMAWFKAIEDYVDEENKESRRLWQLCSSGEAVFETAGEDEVKNFFEALIPEKKDENGGVLTGFKLDKKSFIEVVDRFKLLDLKSEAGKLENSDSEYWLEIDGYFGEVCS